jgi:transglutaminase-like putative cysteine protease
VRAQAAARAGPTAPAPAASTVPATLALTALTLVTAAGMGRLFRGTTWVAPVLGAAAACHAVCLGARRARWPIVVAAVLSVVASFLVVAWAVVPGSTSYGIPTPHTLSVLVHELSRARRDFSTARAPAPALPGFLAAAALAMAVVAVLADWAAFRLHATLEAVAPALAMLVFVSVLATDAHRTDWTAGFVAALALFVVVHESTDRAGERAVFTGGTGRWPYLSPGALALTAGVVAAAVVVGPRLPGAHASAVLSVRHSSTGASRRTTVSPLVDIRSRLVDESNVELFTVQAAQPAYWRLTSLDSFDGNIWSSDEPYAPVGSQIPVPPPPGGGQALSQRYQISDLGSIWLPAAYLPTAIGGAPGVSWDAQSDSLISQAATSDGESYRITSEVPVFNPAQLRQASLAGEVVSPVVQARYTQLPAGVPVQVVALARRITAGAPTPYDKALALQNYLRDNYSYSLNAPAGHSDSALVSFLFETRTGYCEQFAGAYAVMARAVGLPTRVAVGFTPGERQSDGLWHVLGMHAHAWPEVLLGQYGWVAFEPTPGRGMPGATSYTGVTPQQADAGGPGTVGAVPAPTGTTAPANPGGSRLSTRPTTPPAGPTRGRGGRGGFSPLLALLVLAGAAGLWLITVPAVRAVRRRRRRDRAVAEAERVLLAWEEAAEWLALSGAPRRPGETLLEHAGRAPRVVGLGPEAARLLEELAVDAATAAYAPEGRSRGASEGAEERAAGVERAVRQKAGPWRRALWWLDPRPRRSVSRT